MAWSLVLSRSAAAAVGVVTAAALDEPGPPKREAQAAVVGGLVLLPVGTTAGVGMSNRMVRPVEIIRDEIHLTNVSEEFVAAVKAKRRAERLRGGR